jgi:hypothetical protein
MPARMRAKGRELRLRGRPLRRELRPPRRRLEAREEDALREERVSERKSYVTSSSSSTAVASQVANAAPPERGRRVYVARAAPVALDAAPDPAVARELREQRIEHAVVQLPIAAEPPARGHASDRSRGAARRSGTPG